MTEHELITSHLNLARAIAGRMYRLAPSKCDLDEMVGDAYVGLCLAARDFNESLGFKFASYASHRIKGAIIDALRKKNHTRVRNAKRPVATPRFISLDTIATNGDAAHTFDICIAREGPDEVAARDELDFLHRRFKHDNPIVETMVRAIAGGELHGQAAKRTGRCRSRCSQIMIEWRKERTA